MSLKSIAKKQVEIRAARAGQMNGTSDGKRALIRVRTGLLIGGVVCIAAEFAMAMGTRDASSTVFGYLGAGMICGWVVLLFAGLLVK